MVITGRKTKGLSAGPEALRLLAFPLPGLPWGRRRV